MIKELLMMLEAKNEEPLTLVKELISPRGTKVYEWEIDDDKDLFTITVDHDLPEHAFTATTIKAKFKNVISNIKVEKGEISPTSRQYVIKLKIPMTPDQEIKISNVLKKATNWMKK